MMLHIYLEQNYVQKRDNLISPTLKTPCLLSLWLFFHYVIALSFIVSLNIIIVIFTTNWIVIVDFPGNDAHLCARKEPGDGICM